jgi:hypothetical protein
VETEGKENVRKGNIVEFDLTKHAADCPETIIEACEKEPPK